jgi:hypothetical protein
LRNEFVDHSPNSFHGISLNTRSYSSAASLSSAMALSPASSSSSNASGASIHDVNPFHAAAPALPVAASSIPLLNIKHHVPEILDLHDSN